MEESKTSSKEDNEFRQKQLSILNEIAKNTRKESNQNDVLYVVQRRVEIRLKPNNKSANVAVLYPNQAVKLVPEKDKEKYRHEWIYIEYFDFIEGIPKLGWVNKKYLAISK